MDTPLQRIRIAPELELAAPGGELLVAREVYAKIVYEGEVLNEVVLSFEVSPDDWARVDAGAWFQAPPETRSLCFAGGFHDQGPVEIEAGLVPNALTLVALTTENIWEVGAAIRYARVAPALHQTESWRARVVKQRRGALKVGFQTTWGGWTPATA